MIKKKSIVWYYNRKKKEWRKGKVISIYNLPGSTKPYGLMIKERSQKKNYFVPFWHKAYEACEPKPTHKYEEEVTRY